MRIIVTGGSGFIGTNYILKQVLEYNNTIINIDKITYAGNIDSLSSLKSNLNYHFVKGDICNPNIINDLLNKYKPAAILHLAAESHVDRSIDSPDQFIKTNIVGTSILLQSALNYWIKNNKSNFKFLHISTDEVYGSLGNKGVFTEKTPYNPTSPYSASKASSDHLVRAWNRTYGLPTIISNCSNNYGPYQFPEKLIPLMIANCIDENPLPIYGKGENIRDWLFVDDHCNAINKILKEGIAGETYNIGGNNELTNIQIVNLICENLDKLKPRLNGESYKNLITFVEDRP